MIASEVVDLFGGPGGWDLAARGLGFDPLGVEWDDAACATRRAAGLRTLQADVAALRPADFAPVTLLIASPPCQAFSMAGAGEGRAALGAYRDAIERWEEGKSFDVAELDEACGDPRAHLVLEPLRWAYALRPRLIAFEQVEPVLPLWEAMAAALRRTGYSTWTGVLSAEQYGVPQTRRRAFLMASLEGLVEPPTPTHARYVPGRVGETQELGLFDLPDPERIVHPDDRLLPSWVSMADALGWGMTERPYPVVAGGTGGGPDLEKVGGSNAREVLYREQLAGRWAGSFVPTKSGNHADGEWLPPAEWPFERPSTAVMGDPRIASPGYRGGKSDYANGGRPDSMFTPKAYNSRGQRDGRTGVDEPAPTIAAQSRNDSWVASRPATTVAGDPRIAAPGHKRDEANPDNQGRMTNAIRVSIAQAALLQSFPADWPWQGTKTKQFEQVGNAVPPLLARAVLEALTA